MSTALEPLHSSDPAELGGYRLLGRLGEGGQGTVYLAEGGSGARVAIKALNQEAMADPGMRKRFVREAEAARQVASFCTAAVLAADVDAHPPFIVSEYVAGPTLHQRIRGGGPMTGGDLSRLAVATVTALAAVHEAGIVHRDLKPGNVILGEGGARVIDFGIAQVSGGAGTVTTSVIGTPAFMAPEQIAEGRATALSDVFAWGALVAFAATGASPFDGPTVPNVLHRVINDDPDLSRVPEPLRPLVAAALSKDPAARPSSKDVLVSLLGRGSVPDDGGAAPLAAPSVPVTRVEPAVRPRAVPRATDHRIPAAWRKVRADEPGRTVLGERYQPPQGWAVFLVGLIVVMLLIGFVVAYTPTY
ncbi:serine/threonine protein kinase [Nocardiopsis sp. Huas11]|uniref:serine/threonine-protein kinase n=1 Tax=Nocardiopsis sp. Huas11 TaxID=2183912 RepID=UPI000EB44505|nr:serine/threonine-protein kinase [Nocardiopsis sp. Huas11]RKS05938.1 serine/threonine protein kinase [Nocardiopsis sp. Huas11]